MINTEICSGYGQWHSPNNPRNPQPYATTTLAHIQAGLACPANVDKSKAQWAIFSTHASRSHSEQREHGQFVALWADIDDAGGQPFTAIVERCSDILPGFIAYTSRSATQSNQKARLIVPLTDSVSGSDFVLYQKILNDKLQSVGITPDRATERVGQICYLPNKGDYWEAHSKPGELLPCQWATDLAEQKRLEVEAKRAREERTEQARLKAAERLATGCNSPIDAFNHEFSLELMFNTYGYTKRGQKWISPNSESGVPGVSISDDGTKWFSSHDSDAAVGRITENGTMGDSFDLFTHYQHRGDRDAALKAAGSMFTVNGATMTEANQRTYMEAQEPERLETVDSLPLFSLSRFSLNGQAANMEMKMLDDKFVLGRMAIIGQSTVFYAKPNAGKTLLTIWLLIEAIRKGEISGEDVFYINADDNYKGLVQKLKLAEKYGFHMLAPDFKGFKCDELKNYLNALIKGGSAHSKVLILDTVKKFTDLMRKDTATEFGKAVRAFVSHGGTVIMLAHVNKHRDDEQKVVYAGTADLVDDADCAYTLDTVTEEAASGLRTVKFENFKSRGDVARESVYRYDYTDSASYSTRLESVTQVGDEERRQAEKTKRLEQVLERNREAVEAIKECINEGITKKTDLVAQASERSGNSKAKVRRALTEHTGNDTAENQFWHVNKMDKNANVYALNWGVL